MTESKIPSLSRVYNYVESANDWDQYKANYAFVFNGLTTSIRVGHNRGFFDSKFDSANRLGVQEITWLDGKKSRRTCWYGMFQAWETES